MIPDSIEKMRSSRGFFRSLPDFFSCFQRWLLTGGSLLILYGILSVLLLLVYRLWPSHKTLAWETLTASYPEMRTLPVFLSSYSEERRTGWRWDRAEYVLRGMIQSKHPVYIIRSEKPGANGYPPVIFFQSTDIWKTGVSFSITFDLKNNNVRINSYSLPVQRVTFLSESGLKFMVKK